MLGFLAARLEGQQATCDEHVMRSHRVQADKFGEGHPADVLHAPGKVFTICH